MDQAPRKTVKVFVSSPSDVRVERAIARRVIRRLAREFAWHFEVKAVMWEREPLLASQSFQEQIEDPSKSDIVLVILWSRLGVPLPVGERPGPVSGRQVTGTEWEYEDALKAAREHGTPKLILYRKTEPPRGEFGDRAKVEARQRDIEAVADFVKRWTLDAEGKTYTGASWRFADAAAFEVLVEDHLRDLLRQRLGGVAPTVRWHGGSPYRGLETFEAAHEAIFFGRNQARNDIRDLLARQVERGTAFVLVTGASGSGKSSLVRAGVVPSLCEAGMIGQVGAVRLAVMHPASAVDPTAALAAALVAAGALPELTGDALGYTAETLARLLRSAPDQAALPIRQGLTAAGQTAMLTAAGEARLLLVVDQLEELFTMEGADAAMRQRFVEALAGLAASGLVWVVATMRSDFLPRLDREAALARLAAGEAKYFLGPPDATEMRQVVRQPAREAGVRFERDEGRARSLDEEILRAMSLESASLPLLEYLLDQLWLRRSADGVLSFADYDALGGLEGAIGARAEQTLTAQSDEIQAAFPRVLRALATVGQGAEDRPTARRADISRFREGGPERALIAALVEPKARLLVVDGATVRVAHEALLTHWPRARDQLTADRADLQLRARLESAASLWRDTAEDGRDSLLLPAGVPLSRAVDLRQRRPDELDTATAGFVTASVERANRADRRRRFVMSSVAAAATCLAIVFGGLANYAWRASNRSVQSFEAAADALSTLIVSVPESVEPNAPLSTVAALLAVVNKALTRLPGDAAAASSRVHDSRGKISLALADIHHELFEFPEMHAQARLARKEFERALALDADNDEARIGLARAFHVIGAALMERGGNEEARDAYDSAVREFDRVWARYGEASLPLLWRLQRATLYWDMGDLYLQRFKDDKRAWNLFVESLRERWELARLVGEAKGKGQLDPAVLAHGIGWTLNKIGDVHRDRGDDDKALAAYRDAQKTIAGIPEEALRANKHWQSHLAIVHNNIGLLLRRKPDYAGALQAFEEAIAVSAELLKRDPKNRFVQGVLGWSYDNCGETWYRRARDEGGPEHTEEAERNLAKAYTLRTELANQKEQTRRDLVYTEANRAAAKGVAAEKLGDHAAAGRHFDAAAGGTATVALESLEDGHFRNVLEFRAWAARAFRNAGDVRAAENQDSQAAAFKELFRARLERAKAPAPR